MNTPARLMAPCYFCGGEVDTRANGTYEWTCGWVMRREGGGGHGVSLPHRGDRWAHGICVERAVKGQTQQTELPL